MEARFELDWKGGAPARSGGSLILTPVMGEAVAVPIGGEASVSVRLPARSRWMISLTVPGFWAAGEAFSVGESGTRLVRRIVLWPTGRVQGKVRVAESKDAVPKEISLRLEPAPSRSASVPRGLWTCPVDHQGGWACEVPAGTLDLAIQAQGFIPHYRWGLRLAAGGSLPLGDVVLRRGASLAGWVVVEDGKPVSDRCKARLRPAVAPGGAGPDTAIRLQRAIQEVPVDKKGFFQIDGVAPGAYLLEVEQPGYAPARVFPLDVWQGSETFLRQPITLHPPLTLELTVSPSLDWLGKPWRVRIARSSDFSANVEGEPVFDGPADREGLARAKGIAPGAFRIVIADSAGNRFYSHPDLRIDDPDDARQSVEIDLIYVRGTVRLGDEPLAATLWFGGRFGSTWIEMSSDEEGKFEGVLPRLGTWRVDVAASDPKIESHAEVEVKPDREGEAAIEVRLPNTLFFGKVVDEADRPVADANVSLTTVMAAATTTTRSGPDGEVEIRGVPEGRISVTAEASSAAGRLTGDEMIVDLAEGRPMGPLRLVLRRTRVLSGRVQSFRGPVAGAVVRVSSFRPPLGFTDSGRTGLDGSFSVRIPVKAEALLAIVSAPGHALKALEFPVTEHTVILNIPENGGSLDVALSETAEQAQARKLTLAVLQDGRFLPPSTLYRWAAGHGLRFQDQTGIHLPRMAPGEYKVCMGPLALLEDWEASAWLATARCAQGYLSEGSRLDLRLPKE